MNRRLILLFLLVGALVGSCRCSDRPPIPPVDGEGQSSSAVPPPSGEAALST